MYNIKGDLGVLRRIFSRFIRVESLSGNTGNVLAADNNGEIVSRNVDFFLTGSTIFNNKVNNSTFYTYTSTTNTLIGTKLNISDFSSYSANTQNTINNNYSQFTGFTNNFYVYTSTTNTLIGTKLDTSIFANYTANTGSNVSAEFTAFTQTFYQYTADTNNLINTKLDKTTFTAFTNSFYSYSSNTLNTINNNYSQFTGFTNSFNSYSANTNALIGTKLDTSVFTAFTNNFYVYTANTQNTINNNYNQFTGFTQTFYQYTSDTNTLINTKLNTSIFTGFTSSFNGYSANTQNTINNNYSQFTSFTNSFYSYSSNTLNTINNNYNQFTGFTNSFSSYSANTLTSINNKVIELGAGAGSTIRINNCNSTTGIYSSILGGLSGTTTGNYSSILGGLLNNITGVNSSILGGSGNTITSNNSTIGGGRNNTTSFNNTFIFGSSIVANAVDTTYTQNMNACGQTLLQGSSASSGCALLVRNSTPLSLYTALNTGQHLFNGTFTATANNTCGWNLNQTLTQRGTGCDTLYATYINPTIIYTQHNQTNKGLSVQTLFTGTTLTWTGATNIIADFGATNIGTQLTVSDVISGTIYGVNDVSGLPIIDATSNWDVNIYDFPNTVLSKTGKTLTFGVIRNSASTVTVQSDFILNEGIGLGYRMSQVSGLTTGSSVSVLYQLTIPTGQTVFLTANTLGRANNANMDSTISEYKYTAKRSLTGSLTQVGVAQGFVNRDNNNTNVGIDISSNNIRLVVTGNTDTYLWASTIIAQTY